jgi:hypothetical protein
MTPSGGGGLVTNQPAARHLDRRLDDQDQHAQGVSQPAAWSLPSQRRARRRVTPDGQHVRFREELTTASAHARQEAQARLGRVMRYDDLRHALCDMAGGYQRPDQWKGYVPPYLDPDGRPNDSLRRADLVAICAEALRRERAEQGLELAT